MKSAQSVTMDRYMLHLQNNGYSPRDAWTLLTSARELCSNMPKVTLRDSRVSSKYLEFDVSINKEKLNELVENLKPLGNFDHARYVIEETLEKNEAIEQGIFYFNNERYWECHEVLEGVWKNCHEGEKDLVQGIILVAAALVHHQKNEDSICLSIFRRALEKLAKTGGTYYNIDTDKISKKISKMIETSNVSTFKI